LVFHARDELRAHGGLARDPRFHLLARPLLFLEARLGFLADLARLLHLALGFLERPPGSIAVVVRELARPALGFLACAALGLELGFHFRACARFGFLACLALRCGLGLGFFARLALGFDAR